MINKKIAFFTLSLWTFGLMSFQFNEKIKNENRLLNFQLFTLGLFTQWGMIQFGLSYCAYSEKRQSEYRKHRMHNGSNEDDLNYPDYSDNPDYPDDPKVEIKIS